MVWNAATRKLIDQEAYWDTTPLRKRFPEHWCYLRWKHPLNSPSAGENGCRKVRGTIRNAWIRIKYAIVGLVTVWYLCRAAHPATGLLSYWTSESLHFEIFTYNINKEYKSQHLKHTQESHHFKTGDSTNLLFIILSLERVTLVRNRNTHFAGHYFLNQSVV